VRRRLLGLSLGIAACFTAASSAHAVDPPETPGPPETPSFGPDIEPYGVYDEQDDCDPDEKPGVREFANMLLKRTLNPDSAVLGRLATPMTMSPSIRKAALSTG